jgi:hypothetical protein
LALSLFGDAVSALYVPFQSDHKVMAHNVPGTRMFPFVDRSAHAHSEQYHSQAVGGLLCGPPPPLLITKIQKCKNPGFIAVCIRKQIIKLADERRDIICDVQWYQ